jgi:dipeptidyl-peptidase-4
VQIADRLQRRLDLVLVDRASGKTTTVLTETSPTSVTVSDDLTFVEGGRRFLWSSERDGRNHLYLYAIDGTLVRSLTPGEVVVRASSGVAWVRGGVVAVDEARHLVYFTASSGLPIAPALYRVSWDGGEVERVSRTQGTHRVAFDKATARFVDRVASFTTPPSLVLCGADGGEQAVITPPASEFLAPYRVQTPRFFTIPAADGFALPAQITTPRGFDPARRYPVIISVYGGPGAPTVLDDWQRDATFENVLLENGFVCMGIDPRSATGLSRTVQDTSYGKILAAYEVPDILAGVNWLRGQGWVDGERIGVWGWSGGGSTTLQLMTHSRAFKAGIAVAAVTDFRYYDTVYTESVMGLPKDNPEGYIAGAPATVAKDLSGRVLLVHGLYDDNVHPQNAWRFARELQKAGVIFEMMVYPLEKHGLRGVSTHVYGTMLDFWKRSL